MRGKIYEHRDALEMLHRLFANRELNEAEYIAARAVHVEALQQIHYGEAVERRNWENILMNAISNRDRYQVGTPQYIAESEHVTELQRIFTGKFGEPFTYGVYSD